MSKQNISLPKPDDKSIKTRPDCDCNRFNDSLEQVHMLLQDPQRLYSQLIEVVEHKDSNQSWLESTPYSRSTLSVQIEQIIS